MQASRTVVSTQTFVSTPVTTRVSIPWMFRSLSRFVL